MLLYRLIILRDITYSITEIQYNPVNKTTFRTAKISLISEVVLISNIVSYEKYYLGLAKFGLKSEVVLISSSLNSVILLCLLQIIHVCTLYFVVIFIVSFITTGRYSGPYSIVCFVPHHV